ncbi:MAG: ABC transporter permease [Blautia sp.]|nr:ABC transporter permease [Blautia sp.]
MKKTYRIPLICGLVLLLAGIFCFANVCRVKDAIYDNYRISFSDQSIQDIFMNDNTEPAVREAFDEAIRKSARTVSKDAAAAGDEDASMELASADLDAAPDEIGSLESFVSEDVNAEAALADAGLSAFDTVFPKGFPQVEHFRIFFKLQPWFLLAGLAFCLISAFMVLAAKHLDFASIMRSKITWAAIAEILILIVCLIVRPDFFSISYQPSTGMLYGSLIDIVNRSAEITIIAMGMTLVIALGGTDLSVGALVAVAGAIALKLLRWDVTVYNTPGDYSVKPFILVILLPLLACLLMGAFNGVLIGQLNLQPIIATLILMVGGRGIAQICTNGKQFTTLYSPFRWIGQGQCLFLPTPIVITIVVVAAVMIFVRKTAFGTFVESVGINRSASRLSGINAKKVILIVFALTGFLSGIAGLIYSSRIMSCDSNNAGLNYETDAILAVVIGGTNMAGGKFSLSGTIIGSLIIRTIVTFVYYFGIAAEATMAFKALIIAMVIVLQSEPVRNWMSNRTRRRAALKGGENR